MREISFLNKIMPNSVKFEKFEMKFLQDNGSYISDYLEIEYGTLFLLTAMSSL